MANNDNALPDDQQEDIDDLGSQVERFDAVITATDWTVATILEQLRRGNIDLNPSFQRRQAWKDDRKSQFIESLVLNVPVPQIVLAERREQRGRFVVIDGKQRLLTLRQFVATGPSDEFAPFRLRHLPIRKDLNGISYDDLKTDIGLSADLSAFDNCTIRTAVIRNWPNEKFLYVVFLRLNTGSVPLSPQELRQALHPGPFISFVDTYSIDSRILKQVLRLTEPDFRMRDAELVLRYFAFRNFLQTYTGNLKPLLDHTAEALNKAMAVSDVDIKAQISDLESSMQIAIDIFGKAGVFRKWNGTSFEHQINRAIFDIMTVNFNKHDVQSAAIAKKVAVINLFKRLCTDNADFRSSIEGTTKSIEAIFTRFAIWASELSKIGVPIEMPLLIDGRIVLSS